MDFAGRDTKELMSNYPALETRSEDLIPQQGKTNKNQKPIFPANWHPQILRGIIRKAE